MQPFDKDIQLGLIRDSDKNMKVSELDENKKYTEISFMIFRTGSVLIVGNCTEKILRFVYDFIKNLLQKEFLEIRVPGVQETNKIKKEKVRKKQISVSAEYYDQNVLRKNRFV